jgi:teichuronic acid biosynthesis protein TuaE
MIKKLAYLSILASLIGANVISIDFNVFQLSLFRMSIFFITVAIIIQKLFNGGSIKLLRNRKNGYSIKFMLIWLVYSIITLAWVQNYGDWFRTVYFICIGVICVIIYDKYFTSDEDILNAFRALSIMSIIHNCFGWYEIITGNYLFLSSDRIIKYTRYHYPVSMFNNTNNFALFMLFSVFISYVCMVNAKGKIMKFIYIITIISSVCLILSTNSRANLLGLIIGLIVFVFLSITQKKWRYPILILLSILLIVTIILPGVFNNILYVVNKYLTIDLSADKGSDFVRLNLIKNGFIFLYRTCGFGTGAGNIEHWMSNYGVYYTSDVLNIHNWWMEILVNFGVFIFALYLIFYIKLIIDMLHKYKINNNKMNKTLSISFISCMAAYIIGSISASSNISAEWLWVFWALAIAYQGINQPRSYISIK